MSPQRLAELIDPGWAQALAPVEPQIAAMGDFLRAEVAAGRPYLPAGRQVLRAVEVPGALPSILGGLRVGVTLAVVGAIVGEWAGADKGLGVLVNLARGSLFDIPLLFATLATIALLGIVCYSLVVLAERRFVGLR